MSEQYCLYLRKSRADLEAEQRGEGETLARHEHALLDLARRLRLNITQIYREVVSGETIAARPVMQRLLSEVDEGLWSGVLVMEVERLARGDTLDQGIVSQAFKFSGTRIITPSKTYDPDNEFDEEYFEFGLFMSRREYKTINRRLQRGREASVKEGKFVGSAAPYGYSKKKLEHEKGFTLTPNPDEVSVVRLIFDLYVHGEPGPDGVPEKFGCARIASRLAQLHILTKHNDIHWSPSTVRDILTNPVYAGMVRWDWRKTIKRREDGQVIAFRPRSAEYTLVPGRHEAIIDRETFDAAQEIYARTHIPSVHKGKPLQNPLAGLVECGKCGRLMQRRPFIKTGRTPSLICTSTECENVASDLVLVEAKILESLRQWLYDYRLQWEDSGGKSDRAGVEERRRATKKVQAELDTLDAQRGRLHDLLEQGVYDTSTFLERSRALAERISAAQDELSAISASLAQMELWESSRREIIPKVERLLAVYDQLDTPKAKNDMLKEVLEKVVYTKEVSGRWGRPDDFHLTLYPRLPHST